LIDLDPDQRESVNKVYQRDSLGVLDYKSTLMDKHKEISKMPETFKKVIEDCLGNKKAIIVCFPELSDCQIRFAENYRLYHPRLVYVIGGRK